MKSNSFSMCTVLPAIMLNFVGTFAYCEVIKSVTIVSAPVSLGGGDFSLLTRDGKLLYLKLERERISVEWEVKSDDIRMGEEGGWPSVESKLEIEHIALSRWSSSSLLAVVTIKADKKKLFWAMALKGVRNINKQEKSVVADRVLIVEGDSRDRLIALSCNVNSPAFTIVTGKLSNKHPGRIESGSIAFKWFGFLDSAQIGEIVPKYESSERN